MDVEWYVFPLTQDAVCWESRRGEEAELCQANDLPLPRPAMRLGSAQYRANREEVYQSLNMQPNSMKHQLRDYYEEKRQQAEQLRKEILLATAVPERRTNTA